MMVLTNLKKKHVFPFGFHSIVNGTATQPEAKNISKYKQRLSHVLSDHINRIITAENYNIFDCIKGIHRLYCSIQFIRFFFILYLLLLLIYRVMIFIR